jgi:hypothetical protein
MKKIACIAHGPGTANALFPLIAPLKEQYDVHLFPFHPYASKLWETDLCLLDEFNSIFLEDFSLILTGTSSMHEVEKATPILAKEFNIPVVSILDKWDNYENRFQYEPDYIIAIDEKAKSDISTLGIHSSKIFPLGNPHFDRLKPYVDFYEASTPYDVVFFSEPIKKSKEAFYYLVKLMDQHPKWFNHLYVTPHPRENETWLRQYCKDEKNVTFTMYHESFSLLLTCDVSVGVSTSLLYEANIIGKPAIFYRSQDHLLEQVQSLPSFYPSHRWNHFDSTNKCLSFIKNLLK